MHALKLYNTLTRQVEDFTPIHANRVGVYSCGPTVYSEAHIGNMRAFVFADVLRRTLEMAGYDVTHVMNITDVGHLVGDGDEGEDKMAVGAAREGVSAWDIAEKYTQLFLKHSRMLNLKEPAARPKATDFIAEQIDMVKALEEKGYTYATSDGIYFDTSKLNDYGKLAKLDIDGLEGGERVDLGEKKQKTDFALWKFSPEGEKRHMEWDSPWGIGFPGWHIECSAMSKAILGEHFDIHTGGIDHIPVHHTNEIAQSECANGCQMANMWMHSEFLVLGDDVKMSKSKGNVLTVDTVVEKGMDPLALRYLFLQTHYRKPLHFTWEALKNADNALKNLRKQVKKLYSVAGSVQVDKKKIEENTELNNIKWYVFNDLNTPKVLGYLWHCIKQSGITPEDKLSMVQYVDSVLALGLDEATCMAAGEEALTLEALPNEIQTLIAARAKARANKDWAASDAARDALAEAGYAVKDTKDGVEITRTS